MKDGIVPFTPAPFRLQDLLDRAPVFRPVAETLPDEGDPGHRVRCESLLTRLFLRILYLPKLSEQEARRVLQHDMVPDDLMALEFSFMRKHEEWKLVFDDWSRVWNAANDERETAFIRYATALLVRLYRLEYSVRLGRASSRSAA